VQYESTYSTTSNSANDRSNQGTTSNDRSNHQATFQIVRMHLTNACTTQPKNRTRFISTNIADTTDGSNSSDKIWGAPARGGIYSEFGNQKLLASVICGGIRNQEPPHSPDFAPTRASSRRHLTRSPTSN
ncbi:unnamed protein product, partial [Nesidiocoris tenuis]